jgi:hypothetical protein
MMETRYMTDWTDNRKFAGLLRRAITAARAASEVQSEVTEAFLERYGRTHSDIDCDELIDTLDYGVGPSALSVSEVDNLMADCDD